MEQPWIFLTAKERNKISIEAGPYIVDSYEPHEQAVRERNPRENWKGLTKEERQETLASMPRPFYVADLFERIEHKLKEKNT